MSTLQPRAYESTPARNVAFLGLGVMGYPMAAHLARAGHRVTVYNRTTSKSIEWCDQFTLGIRPKHAETPREAAQGADIVFCCVGNDDDLRSVTLGADLGDAAQVDRKSTRLNSSHATLSRMPSSA